jgi:hypothetical protein
MNRLFEIQTLSARNYKRLADPITVITGIATIIPSLFPNLFGSELLTMQHLEKLFPGNGFWTVKYKNHLLQRIKYLKDVSRDLHQYTGEFIEMNQQSICPGTGGTNCWQAFYKLLQKESVSGGYDPVGNIYGGGFDFTTLALVGGGVLLLLALTKKKSRKK